MSTPIRWGILGTGGIARGFAEDLKGVPDASVQAVGSRTEESARAFAAALGVPRVHGSYTALAADPEVDIVYVATPHHRHRDDCLLCLEAGKPVLCEKPFALNAAQAQEVATRAREKGLFCMEAMWTRFLPIVQEARERVRRGEIGEMRTLFADFGYPQPHDPQHRAYDPERGGGALLDLGVYGISLAHWLFGAPETIQSTVSRADTGVDAQSAVLLGYADGKMAVLTSSICAHTHNTATLVGTTGKIVLQEPFGCPPRLTLTRFSATPSGRGAGASPGLAVFKRTAKRLLGPLLRRGADIVVPTAGHGYRYEAIEAMRCLRAGQRESPQMPLDETVRVLETLDAVRAQWGLVYPQERR